MKCKFCSSPNCIKNGFNNKIQRYKCKNCYRNFINQDLRRNPQYTPELKNFVIKMYLNNCGIRRISAILQVPLTTIFNWIKNAGEIAKKNMINNEETPKEIDILEMDELWTYIKKSRKKRKNISEYGLLWIGGKEKLLILK